MAAAAASMGLADKPWAVFDVHHYFSWGGPTGAGIPAANCSTDAELETYVAAGMLSFTAALSSAAAEYSLARIACSEWSLSLHHKDHVAPCTAPNALEVMLNVQRAAFAEAGVAHFFWGWRMPMGGAHEATWSMKYTLSGVH